MRTARKLTLGVVAVLVLWTAVNSATSGDWSGFKTDMFGDGEGHQELQPLVDLEREERRNEDYPSEIVYVVLVAESDVIADIGFVDIGGGEQGVQIYRDTAVFIDPVWRKITDLQDLNEAWLEAEVTLSVADSPQIACLIFQGGELKSIDVSDKGDSPTCEVGNRPPGQEG